MQIAAHIWLPESSEEGPAQTTDSTDALEGCQCLPLREREDGERSLGDLEGHFWLDGAHFCRVEPSQTGRALLAYLVGQLLDALLQLAGSPLCLCSVTDFSFQFTFQLTNLQTTMISDHRWQEASRAGIILANWHDHLKESKIIREDMSALLWQSLHRATSLGNCFAVH